MRFLDRLGRQPMVIVAGWILAAVLGVLVGIVGIGLVGAGLTSRQGTPTSQEDVLRALGESSSPTPGVSDSPTPGGSDSPTPGVSELSATPAMASQSFTTRGGIVVATCDGITAMSPAQGFQVHEQSGREGEFRGIRDNHDRIKVVLTCPNGAPDLRVRYED
ncbi:hypothetical protein ODJ79_05215 [Actinoplanes sp. KI2]|uniref:hypothetical protein n=1 Tax=Actinoplanes sp. KI2 TaxID=2983315 RepID=UPI0021D5E714|nr:hypothetical protein [Actinoplanes sp. KI2]MCU7723107.1 hypothetical protein [Actinoplanes sp. KI2]